ncbi:MAG: hypothetical protein JO112_18045 [Planctomycetes bacterium]|nr:hypothetical protein [Planctomycetota bacterium]
MHRGLLLLAAGVLFAAPSMLRADAFDRYTNTILARGPTEPGVQEVKQLTTGLIADNDSVLPDATGALILVKTNDGRFSKLLVQPARQKINPKTAVPILLIERYVTYQEGSERAVEAQGQNLHLFPGFHLNLDIGQVVPADLGGDLQVKAEKNNVLVEPLGQARLYLVTKPLRGTEPPKSSLPTITGAFEPRFFNGTYKLYDDGRRTGTLKLKVDADGAVTGVYYSDKDGTRYDVTGKVGDPKHTIQFTVHRPRVEEVFQGWMFTGDGKAIAGSSRMQEHEGGFYAVREEQQ